MIMRRVLRASLAVLLLGGLASSVAAQAPASANSWWPIWGQTPAKAVPEPASTTDKAKPAAKSHLAEQMAQLEATLQRRLQVCDELRRVALEIGDDKLEEEAMLLDDLAWKQFEARSSKLLSLGGSPHEESLSSDDSIRQTRELLLKQAENKRRNR